MTQKPARTTRLFPEPSVVFDSPLRIDDHTTLVPVSRLSLRGRAVPIGVFTVADGTSTWTPVVDGGRVALIGVVTGLIAATIGTLAVLRQPPWPTFSVDR